MAREPVVQDDPQQAYIATSRPRHMDPYGSHIVANQGSRLNHIPRSLEVPATSMLRRKFPPPPSVEEEAESLAKEHDAGSEIAGPWEGEPKYRGDADQLPIIMPVDQGRFVIVPRDDDGPFVFEPSDDEETTRTTQQYEANTHRTRKNSYARLDEDTAYDQPEVRRRKSRLDLPRIDTKDLESNTTPTGLHRSKSASYRGELPHDSGYFGSQDHDGPPNDGFLSPTSPPRIIKHSTKGRDRAYVDFTPGNNGDTSRGPSSNRRPSIRGERSERISLSAASSGHRRSSSAIDMPQPSRRQSEKQPSRNEPSSSRTSKQNTSPPLRDRKRSSTIQLDPQNSSPPLDRDKLRRQNSTNRKRDDDDDSSAERERSKSSRRPDRERRKSVILQQPGRSSSGLLSPDSAMDPRGSRSRAGTPLASPKLREDELPGSRTPTAYSQNSAARDRRRREDRAVSPYSKGSTSPSSRSKLREDGKAKGARSRSRAPSFVSATPIAIPTGNSSTSRDRRRSPMPPPPNSRQGTFESSLPDASWPPRSFQPPSNASASWPPVPPLRRYSSSAAPALPACPRQVPKAGLSDWLGIPRCDSPNVCPDCHENIFVPAGFGNHLRPVARAPDRKMACDMGASHWYHIAWFLTQKRGLQNLQLLQDVAYAATPHPPCSGDRRMSRSVGWYTVKDPAEPREAAVPGFNVCAGCTKAVEALFPNLRGTFRSADTRNVTKSVYCSMHYLPERKRFLDYFDLLEATSDNALVARTPPNVEGLAQGLRRLSRVDECLRDTKVDNREWHVMQSLPGFTVCDECFQAVVRPEIDNMAIVARNFLKERKAVASASCQLYSRRMREIFVKACQRSDMEYLETKLEERREVEASTMRKLARIENAPSGEVDADEVQRLVAEWKKWE